MENLSLISSNAIERTICFNHRRACIAQLRSHSEYIYLLSLMFSLLITNEQEAENALYLCSTLVWHSLSHFYNSSRPYFILFFTLQGLYWYLENFLFMNIFFFFCLAKLQNWIDKGKKKQSKERTTGNTNKKASPLFQTRIVLIT